MKNSNSLFFLLILMISGCANNPVWTKPGASSADFKTDNYTCLQESQESRTISTAGGNVNRGLTQDTGIAPDEKVTNWKLYNACMSGMGWQLN